ncbi:NAD(P)/FAD-dependent oxidoreductase [Holzapfeliella sp. He02]|uniref:Ferredoxin--NADP reductase n=1 Tax=Holzapfeliella saturejae TaxID=3082953 RepID=A0ABU8SH40_9LACO
MTNYDVAIIGGGPVGMFAASFSALHGAKPIILESLAEIGGQPKMIYPEKDITDIAGFSKVSGEDITSQLLEQVQSYDVAIKTNFKVSTIEESEFYTLKSELGDLIQAKSIIIATGNGSFNPKKLPVKISNPTTIEEKIYYSVSELEKFTNKAVAVFGGGDSAIDWANMVAEVADHVYLIHRRDKFRAMSYNVEQLKSKDNVTFVTPFLPKDVALTDTNQLDFTLKQLKAQTEPKHLLCDEAIVSYGFNTTNHLLSAIDVDTERGFICVDETMQTNLKNVFAVGDSITRPGHLPLITLGFGEAQVAVTTLMKQLFSDNNMAVHSTSLTKPDNSNN